ncbi:MAG: SAM hydrolase/SAM-dependent halogenase family protein [Terriglobales bacterium]
MPPPLITLSSDFGGASAFAAILRGALLRRCPEARLLDLSHELGSGDVFAAALLLLRVYSYYPAGTIHLLALDRGTGPDRVLVAFAASQCFVAMDDGGLGLVLQQETEAQVCAVALRERTTFVARDAMADIVAQIVRTPGHPPGLPVTDWRCLEIPKPTDYDGGVLAQVLFVDAFGNLVLNVRAQAVGGWQAAEIGGQRIARWRGHYGAAPLGELLLMVGAEGWMEIAAAGDSAAARLDAHRGTTVRLLR